MNEVFLIGTIITKIEFKFIVNNNKKFAKVKFKILTLDKQEINIIGYNKIADFALKNLKMQDKIYINGKIKDSKYVEIIEILV